MENARLILSLLVNNESGVLTRISGLFARRGFNIDSLSVGETQNPRVSRITIQAAGDEYVRDQIMHQLEKLHDVKVVKLMA
ncbi:MAG TPA: acetolactate synthase small subunit, partial [Candidatus Limiplasma sp.]|nr:acetolactate synthase small subunit [Candidatus Limiplasma sp.]